MLEVYGDRDPTSAGTVGDAVVRVGSRAAAGMPANPDEARQVGRHIADRSTARNACGSEVEWACRECGTDLYQTAARLCE